ncbi:predicted protein [Naegleria gruberi]|uniref:Predicted protein n=1 Tax=Naegleria gruberi TaxID=5762 RepID=D2UXS4_NAEGR|nr:uncharacterized protein NAEGRDRAFT_61224 [Naegleria gruberi]EFC50341.1 predicted protein [Naegleria gruberi]|eukprot:XP_002683085.1 predicted protein [Naegleria gruberi strain NEG-M]
MSNWLEARQGHVSHSGIGEQKRAQPSPIASNSQQVNFVSNLSTSGSSGGTPSVVPIFNIQKEVEDLSNKIYSFMYTVGRIESHTKELEKKDSDSVKNKLKAHREKAKKELRWLLQKFEEISCKAPNLKDSTTEKVFEKITKQFKDQFERFQNVSKHSIEVEKKHLIKVHSRSRQTENSALVDDTENNDTDGEYEDHKYGVGKYEQEQQDLFEQRLILTEFDHSMIQTEKAIAEERLNELKQLEVDMNDIYSCYVDLSSMIKQQGETMDTVESNILKSNIMVEEGVEYIETSRKKLSYRLVIQLLLIAGFTIIVILGVVLGVIYII